MPVPDPLRRYPLSKDQRNDLYRAIEASSVPVTDFELTEAIARSGRAFLRSSEPCPVTVIRHLASGSMCCINRGEMGRFWIGQQLGAEGDLLENWRRSSWVITRWGKVVSAARAWAERTATPDLWNELRQGIEFFAGQHEQDIENTPFDNDEQARISEQIRQIKVYIKTTHELTSEQISRVEARMEHAEEASRRMGRKDWITLFNGAVLSLIFTDTITPDTAQHIILMTINGLGHLFGIGGPLHLPPG